MKGTSHIPKDSRRLPPDRIKVEATNHGFRHPRNHFTGREPKDKPETPDDAPSE